MSEINRVLGQVRPILGLGNGHDYDRHWQAPRHVYGYRGPVLHPRYYRRPACLHSWLRWEETGSAYWRLRYLACVL